MSLFGIEKQLNCRSPGGAGPWVTHVFDERRYMPVVVTQYVLLSVCMKQLKGIPPGGSFPMVDHDPELYW